MTGPGIYRHFKGGRYRVLFTAIDAENGSEDRLMVVYICLDNGLFFVRPEGEFSDWIPHPKDGEGFIPRFKMEEL